MSTPPLPLPPRGYVVVDLDLSPETLEAMLKQARKRAYIPVFLTVGGATDPFRLQSRVALKTQQSKAKSKRPEKETAAFSEVETALRLHTVYMTVGPRTSFRS